MIPGSDRIPGSINTTASAAKTLPGTRSVVSAKLKLSQLSTVFNIAKEKLFLDLTLWKNGNCGENGSLSHNCSWLSPAYVPFPQHFDSGFFAKTNSFLPALHKFNARQLDSW